MTWAKVGAKCVCVDVRWDTSHSMCPLIGGETYTIIAVASCTSGKGPYTGRKTTTVVLAEVSNPTSRSHGDYGFVIDRFRPLVSLEDDIAVFKRIADQVPNMEEVE